ncbi:MAG: hypothetical protein RH917_09145 [Lacipirellulaceae bacterium]
MLKSFHFTTLPERFAMNLSQFYNEVARKADTKGTSISAAETKRVLSEMFLLLAKMDATDATAILSKGLTAAKKKGKK